MVSHRSKDAVRSILERFETKYKIVMYSSETNEVAIKNYLLHSITKGGPPVLECLKKDEKAVKDKHLVSFVVRNISGKEGLLKTVKDFIDYLVNEKGYALINYNDNDNENDNEDDNDNDNDNESNDSVTVTVTEPLRGGNDELFESLWELYPKKRNKGKVSKKSKREIEKVGYDHMVRAIERYAAQVKGRDQQYTMYGSTFFNGGYIDFLDENYEAPAASASRATQEFQTDIERMATWAERRKANDCGGVFSDSGSDKGLLPKRENNAG